MVEHSPAAGACIAQLDLSANQGDVLGLHNSPSKSAQDPEGDDCEQHRSQMECSQQSTDSVSNQRLASGSRRRRRNGARPVVHKAEVQPKAARVVLQPVHTSNGDDLTRGVLMLVKACPPSLPLFCLRDRSSFR